MHEANVRDLQTIDWYCTLDFEVEGLWPPEKPIYAGFVSQGRHVFIMVAEPVPTGGRFNFNVMMDMLWERLR
jgi:hypothetical protein